MENKELPTPLEKEQSELPPLPTNEVSDRESTLKGIKDGVRVETKQASCNLQSELPHNPDLQVITRLLDQISATSATEVLSVEQKNIFLLLETYTDTTTRKNLLAQRLNMFLIDGKGMHTWCKEATPANITQLATSPRNEALVKIFLRLYTKDTKTEDVSVLLENYRSYIVTLPTDQNTLPKHTKGEVGKDLIDPIVLIEHLKEHPKDHLLEDSIEQYILAIPYPDARQQAVESYVDYLLQHGTSHAQFLWITSLLVPNEKQLTIISKRTGDTKNFNQDNYPQPELTQAWVDKLDLSTLPFESADKNGKDIADILYEIQVNLLNGQWNKVWNPLPAPETTALEKLLPSQRERYITYTDGLQELLDEETTAPAPAFIHAKEIAYKQLIGKTENDRLTGRDILLKQLNQKIGATLVMRYQQASDTDKETVKKDIIAFAKNITDKNLGFQDYITAGTTLTQVLMDRIDVDSMINTSLVASPAFAETLTAQCTLPAGRNTLNAQTLCAQSNHPLTSLILRSAISSQQLQIPLGQLTPLEQIQIASLYHTLAQQPVLDYKGLVEAREKLTNQLRETTAKTCMTEQFGKNIDEQLNGLTGVDQEMFALANTCLAQYDITQMGPLEAGFGQTLLKGLKVVGRGGRKALTFVPRVIKGATSRAGFFIAGLIIGGLAGSYITYKLMGGLRDKAEVKPLKPLTKEDLINTQQLRTTLQGYSQTVAAEYDYFVWPQENDDRAVTKLTKELFQTSMKDQYRVTAKGYLEAYYDLKEGPFEILDNPDKKSITLTLPPVKITPALTTIDVDVTGQSGISRLLPSSMQPEKRNQVIGTAVEQIRNAALDNSDQSINKLVSNSEQEATAFWVGILSATLRYPKENIIIHFNNSEEAIIVKDPTLPNDKIPVKLNGDPLKN